MTPEINCLRCRFCRATPDTDFSKLEISEEAPIPIYCGKLGRNRPAILFQTRSFSSSSKATKGFNEKRTPKIKSDKVHWLSEVERLFVTQMWSKWTMRQMMALTGHDAQSLWRYAKSLGFKPKPVQTELQWERHSLTKQKRGHALTQGQRDLILELHASPLWLKRGNFSEQSMETRRKNQEMIVSQVSQLGRKVTWRTCVEFVYHQSPGFRRKR